MFSGISLTCFAASYALCLGLEIGRMFYQLGRRPWLVLSVAVAGFLAHTGYLVLRFQDGLAARGVPLSNWYHWCLVAAWVVALVYVLIVALKPRNTVGIFLLPLVLALIGVAQRFPKDQLFATNQATQVWGVLHGGCLLLGTVGIVVGFAAGLMYLIQAYRLKHKIAPRKGFRLPSLEWLRNVNERCLIWSTLGLVMGVLAGVVLNLSSDRDTGRGVALTDPTVWMSALLLLWLVAATAFVALYKPAREGRKVAYLTVTSFLMLLLTLCAVVFSRHATPPKQATVVRYQAVPKVQEPTSP